MAELPPRTVDDEIKHQVEVIRRDLEREFKEHTEAQSDMLKREAESYRGTLLWFTTGVGLLLLGVVVTWADQQIDETITARTADLESRVELSVNARIEDRLDEELSVSTLLPLLVGEAIALSPRQSVSYTHQAADQVLEGLTLVRDEILALDGLPRALAMQRISSILRAFWGAGDYTRVLETHTIFGPALLEHDATQAVLLESAVSLLVVEGHGPQNQEFIAALMSTRPTSEIGTSLRALLGLMVEYPPPWDTPEMETVVASVEAGMPGFAEFTASVILLLNEETQPGERNHSTLGRERYNQILQTLAVVASAAQN